MAVAETYPLTPLQQGMLFQHLKDSHAGVDIEQLVVQLREVVDEDRLLAAWHRVVDRHPALRTRFRWEDCSQPVQEIVDQVNLELRTTTATTASSLDRQGQIQEFLAEDRRRGFVLQEAPLLRLTLFRWAANDFTLVWTFHHILLDGRSIAKVVGEVFELYDSKHPGEYTFAATAPPPYSRFVEWLTEQNRQVDDRFFRELLGDFSAPTPLVIDHAGSPVVGSDRQGEASGALDASTTDALRRLTAAHDLTMNALVMAAWAVLLSRYSGESTVVFGATRACRRVPVEGASEMVGLLINTLPVRVDLPEGATILEIAQAVRQLWLALRPHEHLPLTLAKSASAIQGTLPLFETLVVFERQTLADALRGHGPAWASRTISLHELTSVPVTLAVYDGAALQFKLEHDLCRVSADAAARTIGHLATLLTAAAAEPGTAAQRLPILTTAEREQLLVHFNRTECVYPEALSLTALFEEQVARTPAARALTFENRSLSYRDLDERANQLAHHLIKHGVGPDVLVGICMERSLEMVVGLLGILKAGGAYVPFDPTYPRDRLAYMLEDAGATVLLTQEHLRATLPPHHAEVISLDAGWHTIASESSTCPPSRTTPDHLAYMIYTSGSTGRPKGALNTHRGIMNRLHWMQAEYRLTTADTVLQKTPFSFDVSVWEFFWPLLTGARLVVARPEGHKDPDYLVELIEKECVTVLHFVPSMLRAFLEADGLAKCGSLREVICSGEALPPDLVVSCHAKLQANLHNLYGPTEAAVDVTYWACPRDRVVDIVPIGRPVANTQCYILDAHLQPVPVGVAGELHLGGVQIGRGYHHRPDLTAQKFIPDPFRPAPDARLYKTGDLCRYLPDGNIEYLGRIDHQVKIRGFRVELGEIEAVLSEHPAIREALVLAREEAGTTRLVAYAVVPAVRPAVGELREHLRRKLPDYMVPAAFVFLENFPLSHNGKIDRKALPEPDCDRAESATAYAAPVSPAEQELARIWSGVLRRDRVGIDDNFFELGGDSILSIQVISLARKAGLNLSPRLLFQHPTIRHLAVAAGSPAESPTAAKEQGPVSGAVGLTPILHWFFEQKLAEPNHYNQAFLLELRSPIDPDPLRRALARLELQHDVLRVRLTNPDGLVIEHCPPGDDAPLEMVDLSSESDAGLATRLEERCGRAQASLDLTCGPLWRAVLFQLGPNRPPRLLLAVHHLAVDGVSWRILVEDLEQAYIQEESRETAKLPAKTTSFQAWAKKLQDAAGGGHFADESDFWCGQLHGDLPAIPIDFNRGPNTESSARTVTMRLEPAETLALLQQAPARYNTRINDLLLSALGVAMSRWTGSDELAISLETHGREDLFEQVDLSRTVGWFTAIHPLRLRVGERDTGRLICAVKEQLRAVPHNGVGYGVLRYLARDPRLETNEPELVFNYLGQFDQVVADSHLFRFAAESTGPWHSPQSLRQPLLEVNAMVVGGSLEFAWTYSANRHAPETIERLARSFAAALREVIQHCLAAARRGATPSDFPLAALDQPALDRLLQQAPDLEDVYPLSPIQALFHTVAMSDHRKVLDHWHCRLNGPLEGDRFQQAWRTVLARHPVLRTSFHSVGPSRTVQVVHSPQPVEWTIEDWRTLPAKEQERRWLAWLKADHDHGLPLDQAPLSRFALFQLGEEAWRFVWTVPALLLDGWSWPLVFRDLCRVYEQLSHGAGVELEPAPPYRCYLEWLARRGTQDAETFWKAELAGITAPTPLVAGDGSAVMNQAAVPGRSEWRATIPAGSAEELIAFARRQQVSPSTLIQAAWAATMARQSGRRDVLFGAAFSGRPADLDRAGDVVGPFVNNLPVRVTVTESTRLRDWLADVQDRLLRINEHQFVSALKVQGWSEIPWRHRLFESLVVVQNYVVVEAARRVGPRVSVEEFVGPIHSNLPLLLLVEPRTDWQVTLIFDPREVPAGAAARWGADFCQALERMAARPDDTVGELLAGMSTPAVATAPRPRWQVAAQDYAAPGSELERRIARLWAEWLGLERISVEQNVFDLGVHSLLVVRLHEALCRELQRELPLIDLFQYPTVRALAGRLEGSAAAREQETARALSGRASRQREAMGRMKSVGRGK